MDSGDIKDPKAIGAWKQNLVNITADLMPGYSELFAAIIAEHIFHVSPFNIRCILSRCRVLYFSNLTIPLCLLLLVMAVCSLFSLAFIYSHTRIPG